MFYSSKYQIKFLRFKRKISGFIFESWFDPHHSQISEYFPCKNPLEYTDNDNGIPKSSILYVRHCLLLMNHL